MIIKISVLLIGYLGYYLFYKKSVKAHLAFFPILFASMSTVVAYLGGLVGMLKWTSYIVGGIGVILCVFCMWDLVKTKSFKTLKVLIHPVTFFLIFAVLWAFFDTKNIAVEHYDDFGHWYRTIKSMAWEGAFPSMPDTNFPTYVPGGAVWVYFFTRYVGFNVRNCFWAQNILSILCCATFFAIIPEKGSEKTKPIFAKKMILVIVGIMLTAVLMGINKSFFTLQVDTILALVPMAGMMILMFSDDDVKSSRWQFAEVLLISCFTIIIKTSGLLFVVFLSIAWMLKFYKKQENDIKKIILKGALIIAIPLLLFVIYMIRVRVVFGDVSNTSQAVSMTRYMTIFNEKSLEDIVEMTCKYFHDFTDMKSGRCSVKIIWFSIIMLIGTVIINKKKEIYPNIILSFLGAYLVGLYLTFMFSLGKYETTKYSLDGFDRYAGTAAVFIFGVVVAYVTRSFVDKENNLYVYSVFVLVTLTGLCSVDTGYIWGRFFLDRSFGYTGDMWRDMDECLPENLYYTDNKYVVVFRGDRDYPNDINIKISAAVSCYMRTKESNVEFVSYENIINETITDEEREIIDEAEFLITLKDYSEDYDKFVKAFPIAYYGRGLLPLAK